MKLITIALLASASIFAADKAAPTVDELISTKIQLVQIRNQNLQLEAQQLQTQFAANSQEIQKLVAAAYEKAGVTEKEYTFDINTMQFVAKQKPAAGK
jgi:hypothetical protein